MENLRNGQMEINEYNFFYDLIVSNYTIHTNTIRKQIKEKYFSGFDCDIEDFFIVLPIKYKDTLNNYKWIIFSEFVEKPIAFRKLKTFWHYTLINEVLG